ncbi:hypothetical protein [Bradyrhizobium sp. Ce-3]|uniref:hypothetical protein n=1 Tax=Bradyrhizobium sp. Ce-3 TaxID=2913970 RepID=UPI001FBB9201|nr:hypothetical protein [Bradyrhizobium sp. Ce-3]
MQSRWLKLVAFLLLITVKEPAMAENLAVSQEMRSEIAALVAAEEAAWNSGSAEAFCRSSASRYCFHQYLWHVLNRQTAICRPT